MQLITVLTVLTAAASTTSAWKFSGWDKQLYQGGLVISRSGNVLTNNLCADIIINDNKMSSFQWNQDGDLFCAFKLFDGHGCKGRELGSSTGSWNVPAISTKGNNKASSLWVDCLRW